MGQAGEHLLRSTSAGGGRRDSQTSPVHVAKGKKLGAGLPLVVRKDRADSPHLYFPALRSPTRGTGGAARVREPPAPLPSDSARGQAGKRSRRAEESLQGAFPGF